MDSVIAELEKRLVQNFKKSEIDATAQEIRVLKTQEKSIIFLCRMNGIDRDFIVKLIRKPSPTLSTEKQAIRECEALSSLHEIRSQEGLHISPKPYSFMTDIGAVVMDYLVGPSLTEYIVDIRVPQEKKVLALGDAGRWISSLHQHFSPKQASVPYDRVIGNLEGSLSSSSRDSDQMRAFDTLRSSHDSLKATSVDVTRLHGDFKADNLVVSGDRVFGLDTRLEHTGMALRDIAYFANHLDLIFDDPRVMLYRWSLRPRLHKAFVNGVRENWEPEQYLVLFWMRLASALMSWTSFMPEGGLSLRQRYLQFSYKRLTLKLARQVSLLGRGAPIEY